jgi:hypothetical protein
MNELSTLALTKDDIPLAKAAFNFLKEHFFPAKRAKPLIVKKKQEGYDTSWKWIKLTDGLKLCEGVLCPVSVQWTSKKNHETKWSSTSPQRIKKVKEACDIPQHLSEFMRNAQNQMSVIRYIFDYFNTPAAKRSSLNPAFNGNGSRNVQLLGSGASEFAAPAPSLGSGSIPAPFPAPSLGSGSIPAPFPLRQFTGKVSCVQHAYNNARFSLGNFHPLRLQGCEFICLHDFAQWIKRQDISLHRLKRIRCAGYSRGLFNSMQHPNRYVVIVFQHCLAIDLSKQGFVYDSDPAAMFNFGIPFQALKKDCSNIEELTNYYEKVLKMDLLKHIKQVWKVIV